jgi:competence protein ComEA
MAARVRDGMQVKVPFLGGGSGGLRVNINLATRDELLAIPGLSPSMADAILSYRDGYGGFESLRELVTVLGLDAYDYDLARRHLTL